MAVRDVVQAAAGVGGAGEYVEDVFSTYLYTGNGGTQTINNGIDLDGEGGLVWTKSRSASSNNALIDTVVGRFENAQSTNLTAPIPSSNGQFTGFLSNGYSLNQTENTAQVFNVSSQNYVSWTFRKAPKFFDVVTYTGNSVFGRQIPHNLGSVPGCIIVKRTNAAASWYVYHRGVDASAPQDYTLVLDLDLARINSSAPWADTAPTDSVFTVGDNSNYNETGSTYVAYLFAHDAGGFGDDGEQNVISCGSYTGNNAGVEINLGWEPQWFMCKKANGTADWQIFDVMRGMHFGTSTQSVRLSPNTTGAETSQLIIGPSSTGVSIPDASDSVNINGGQYIYIAIRRPMKTPESGTEVFAIAPRSSTAGYNYAFVSNFPVDMGMSRNVVGATEMRLGSRLQGDAYLQTPLTSAEASSASWYQGDSMNSVGLGFSKNNEVPIEKYGWMFKRAPGFFDVVAYTGTGAVQNVAHNLGVAPELLIVKSRSLNGQEWPVQVLGDGTKILKLNSTSAFITNSAYWNDTGATESVFTVTGSGLTGSSGATYIAYLFASLPGVSKVGSYTGTGADLNVDCGFSAGARFILIKRTDSTGDWYVWDSARGIVAGNDPYLLLNNPAPEVTTTDYIDPLSSGFTVTSSAPAALNASGGSYIFLAIA